MLPEKLFIDRYFLYITNNAIGPLTLFSLISMMHTYWVNMNKILVFGFYKTVNGSSKSVM